METKLIQTTFGNTIKLLRNEKGISQEKLAELSDLHRTYISDVERGARNVSLVNIVRIAEGLKVEISELFKQIEVERQCE